MPSLTRRTALMLLGAASAVPAIAAPGADAAPGPRREWKPIPPREAIRTRYFPNHELVTHEGRKVLFYDDLIRNKVLLLNFMFASCERICPRVVDNLVSVQRLLGARVGRDVFMYSFTLDPRHDTPAILADYARMHSVGPGWLFLGGKPAVLEDLRKRLGFVDPDPKIDKDRENHIGNVRYGNEARQLWGACPGMSRPEYIVESLSWVQARG